MMGISRLSLSLLAGGEKEKEKERGKKEREREENFSMKRKQPHSSSSSSSSTLWQRCFPSIHFQPFPPKVEWWYTKGKKELPPKAARWARL